jgi:hypothetical protein
MPQHRIAETNKTKDSKAEKTKERWRGKRTHGKLDEKTGGK